MVYSYSSLATYKQCPAKFKFAYIDRVETGVQPPSPAMERGSKIHESVEQFLLGHSEFMHPDIHKNYGQFMSSLREDTVVSTIYPEYKWGITWEMKPCSYAVPECMLHGYMDLLVVPPVDQNLAVYEWKTGGIYPEHISQIHKYGVAAMCHFPDHPGVDAMATYFDHQDYRKIHYPRTMMFEYKPFLRHEIGTVADATKFPEMPSFKCKWCQFSRDNGGPCRF